jgi:hypothetical protein
VPVRLAVSVPAAVLTLSVLVRGPVTLGVKLTFTPQLAFAASELVQVVDTKLKSELVTDAAEGAVRLSAVAPLLIRVAVCAAVVEPTSTLPKARLGVSDAFNVLPLPLVSLAWGAEPGVVANCPKLYGTVLCTVAVFKRPRIHRQVLSALQSVLSRK